MTKKITMTFDTEGDTKIEVEGYEGGTCLDATAAFENIFAKQSGDREMVGACAGDNPDYGERIR
jgi:hypothetical protein